ncbi:B3/B4 domain-containing protein [Pelolinea submarina]|uniref:Phosphoenolpyruvate synthase n=1 Tax=Pelolinea submarina TaxID=913107 RepID=A0A347ZPD2_9CHLR|nr:phenylalanine--tRNA ligase beta subunit-related protein [Pelolinea submarina]REG08764.1 phosphoenolpyruvate synthase [Pelolinea submarina]BBB47163.1 lysyl-tRNA synthetase, class II [Pelolinea submarina]
MKTIQYSIAPQVFEKFPDYIRGVVLAVGVSNGKSSPELVQLLRDEEKSLQQRLNVEEITDYPKVNSWREAFRSLGIKPSEYRSSIEAMSRRVLRGNELPSINALVDIGNILSLRHLVPTGGHALDAIQADISLRPADGSEEFVPFGSEEMEHPDPDEFVFVEGNTVLTRRWSWRQANHSLTLPSTKIIEFNIDGLPPVSMEEVELVAKDMFELVSRFCGGELSVQYITRDNPSISLTF